MTRRACGCTSGSSLVGVASPPGRGDDLRVTDRDDVPLAEIADARKTFGSWLVTSRGWQRQLLDEAAAARGPRP